MLMTACSAAVERVELLLDTDDRDPQHLAQFGLELGADLRALVGGRQQVVDGIARAQLLERVRELFVGEPGHGAELVGELLLPHLGLVGELRLVGRGLLGQPLLERPGLLGELGLVGAGAVGEPGLVDTGVLGQLRLQCGAFGAELPLQARDMLLPLLGVLGLRGAETAFRTAQLSLGADEQSYAHGAGRRGRRSGRGRSYSLRAHEGGGDRPTSQGQRHQPPAVPGDRGPRRRWRSGEFHLHPSKRHERTWGVCEDGPHSGGRTASRPVSTTSTRCAAREPMRV